MGLKDRIMGKKKGKAKDKKDIKEKEVKQDPVIEVPEPPKEEPVTEIQRRALAVDLFGKLIRETAELEGQKYMAHLVHNRQLLLVDLEFSKLLNIMSEWFTEEQLEELKTKVLEELENRPTTT